jgi:hypothetical protein
MNLNSIETMGTELADASDLADIVESRISR